MALFGSITHADKIFADQFEPMDDGNFTYRRNRQGASIKVSPLERDKFVEAFIKTRQRVIWVLIAGMIIASIAGVAIFGDAKSPNAETFIYIEVGLLIVGYLIFWQRAWNAPTRNLANRQPQGLALEKNVARRAALKRMEWGQFVWAGLITTIGGVAIASKINVLSDWNQLWLVGGALFVALLGWRIWQKLQADRSSD